MMFRYLLFFVICNICFQGGLQAQESQYKVAAVGFYNLENLFDTIKDLEKNDGEFTPVGSNKYDSEVYWDKISKLSKVIGEIATDITPDGLAVLGVCEVEHAAPLQDLAASEVLKDRNYQIIHHESPDYRGIDVGLMYNPLYFTPEHHVSYTVRFEDDIDYVTRDQLLVSGLFDGEEMHFIINHWPSRRGGESKSEPKRIKAAQVTRSIIDSIQSIDPLAKIIVMGDFNDNPNNLSLKGVLKTADKQKKVSEGKLFNPYEAKYKKGMGTAAYRDNWNVFDMIIVSEGLLGDDYLNFSFYKSYIFSPKYLKQSEGRYAGYPYRSYVGTNYMGGYSDHFPVYLLMIKLDQAD